MDRFGSFISQVTLVTNDHSLVLILQVTAGFNLVSIKAATFCLQSIVLLGSSLNSQCFAFLVTLLDNRQCTLQPWENPRSAGDTFFSSIRRGVLSKVPPSVLEEMRPMMSSSSSASGSMGAQTPSGGGGGPGGGGLSASTSASLAALMGNRGAVGGTKRPPRLGGAGANNNNSNNMEIWSVRDRTDATAKRGFRVQVPKRLLAYVMLVFFVLPLLLSIRIGWRRIMNSETAYNEAVQDSNRHPAVGESRQHNSDNPLAGLSSLTASHPPLPHQN